MKIKVLEVDQWTSTGDITSFTMEQAEEGVIKGKVRGGDSEAIATIFGGHFLVREVEESEFPSKGNVWLINGSNGLLEMWKCNYDTSD